MAVKATAFNGNLIEGHAVRVDLAAAARSHDNKRAVFLGNLDFKVQEDEVELLDLVPSNNENTIEPLSVLSSDDKNSIPPLSLLSSKSDDFHSRTVKAYSYLLNP